MFVLLFWDKLVGFFTESPFWYELQSHEACDNYWWTNLLYINNFYPTTIGDVVSLTKGLIKMFVLVCVS